MRIVRHNLLSGVDFSLSRTDGQPDSSQIEGVKEGETGTWQSISSSADSIVLHKAEEEAKKRLLKLNLRAARSSHNLWHPQLSQLLALTPRPQYDCAYDSVYDCDYESDYVDDSPSDYAVRGAETFRKLIFPGQPRPSGWPTILANRSLIKRRSS